MNFRLEELSNDDIDSYLKKFPLYRGTYSCRHLPKIEKGVYIVNMDISPNGGGTHWTLVSNLEPKRIIYFDPFGLPPNTFTDKWMRSSHKPLFYSNLDYQNLDSNACGYFCVDVAQQLLKGRKIDDVIKGFSKNTMSNEHKLEYIFIL